MALSQLTATNCNRLLTRVTVLALWWTMFAFNTQQMPQEGLTYALSTIKISRHLTLIQAFWTLKWLNLTHNISEHIRLRSKPGMIRELTRLLEVAWQILSSLILANQSLLRELHQAHYVHQKWLTHWEMLTKNWLGIVGATWRQAHCQVM